jgi:hypothetical protein
MWLRIICSWQCITLWRPLQMTPCHPLQQYLSEVSKPCLHSVNLIKLGLTALNNHKFYCYEIWHMCSWGFSKDTQIIFYSDMQRYLFFSKTRFSVSEMKLFISLNNLCVKQYERSLKCSKSTVKHLAKMWWFYDNSWDIHMLDKISTMKIVIMPFPLRQQALVLAVLSYFYA